MFLPGRLPPHQREKGTQIFHRIYPLTDPRWKAFVHWHPSSSVFHTNAWLEALQCTYGYEPVAYTSSPPGTDVRDGIPFCRIGSWLTGRRLVSLPFSDHCEPLVAQETLPELYSTLEREVRGHYDYCEVRPLRPLANVTASFHSTVCYRLHLLDLKPNLETVFGNCHRNSTQRKVRRAEREGVVSEEGGSERLLDAFYRLLVMTRRRHGVPPQPKLWFENLIACFGEALKIRVALARGQAIAAILTLRHKETLVYKYACSDPRFHSLGAMHFLIWRAIREAYKEGLGVLDFGRSEVGQTGLITFKERWGAVSSPLIYSRLTRSGCSQANDSPGSDWRMKIAKRLVSRVPGRVLASMSRIFFRHIG